MRDDICKLFRLKRSFRLKILGYKLCKINSAIVLYASYPSYQAFIVTLLHQDTSVDHQRRVSR